MLFKASVEIVKYVEAKDKKQAEDGFWTWLNTIGFHDFFDEKGKRITDEIKIKKVKAMSARRLAEIL